MKFCLVIPSFRNETTVFDLVKTISDLGFFTILINDGGDAAFFREKLADFTKQTVLINHPINQGKGAALKAGIKVARSLNFTHAISIDSDGQHDPSDIHQVMLAAKRNPAHLIIGHRLFEGSLDDVPLSSRIGRTISNFWIWVETFFWPQDSQSGLRCYPLREFAWEKIACNRFEFEAESLVKYLWSGGHITEVSIDVRYPKNRISSFHKGTDNFRLIKAHAKLVIFAYFMRFFAKNPSKEAKGASLLRRLLGLLPIRFVYFCTPFITVYYFLFHRYASRGYYSFYRLFLDRSRLKSLAGAFLNLLTFALTIVDRLSSLRSTSHMSFDSSSLNLNDAQSGQVLMGAHMGDWMIAGKALTGISNKRLLILMNQSINPDFMRQFASWQSRLSFSDLESDRIGALLSAREYANSGDFIGILPDRVSKFDDKLCNIEFLGKTLHVSLQAFKFVLSLKKPASFFLCLRDPGLLPKYRLTITKLWDANETISPEILAKRYFLQLAKAATDSPHNWFNYALQDIGFDISKKDWLMTASSKPHQMKAHKHVT